jgi:hypothetical protein
MGICLRLEQEGPVEVREQEIPKVYIEQDARRPADRRSSSLPPFVFGNGYSLAAFDLGNSGVKVELGHEGDVGAAVILPPEEVHKLGRWLLRTLGQDRHGLPEDLGRILERLSKTKVEHSILERGDKKRIKEALRALKT